MIPAEHMPEDPNAVPKTEPDPEPVVKVEPYDVEFARNKEFRTRKAEYKCRICKQIFTSRYGFSRHILTHEVRCANCHVKYDTWRQLNEPEPHCPRRYGRTLIRYRQGKPKPKPKTPFKCALCKRRYEKYQHLFDHQVKRCKKRYVADAWVVKI